MKATFLLLVESNGWFNWKQCNAGYWLWTMHGRYWAVAVLLCCRLLTGQQLRFYLTMAPHSFAWTLGVVQTLYTETTVLLNCNKDRREQILDIHQTFKGFWFHSLSKVLLLTCVTKCFYQMFPKCFPKWFYQTAIWVPMWVIPWS